MLTNFLLEIFKQAEHERENSITAGCHSIKMKN